MREIVAATAVTEYRLRNMTTGPEATYVPFSVTRTHKNPEKREEIVLITPYQMGPCVQDGRHHFRGTTGWNSLLRYVFFDVVGCFEQGNDHLASIIVHQFVLTLPTLPTIDVLTRAIDEKRSIMILPRLPNGGLYTIEFLPQQLDAIGKNIIQVSGKTGEDETWDFSLKILIVRSDPPEPAYLLYPSLPNIASLTPR